LIVFFPSDLRFSSPMMLLCLLFSSVSGTSVCVCVFESKAQPQNKLSFNVSFIYSFEPWENPSVYCV
jgi:hypothetical protein